MSTRKTARNKLSCSWVLQVNQSCNRDGSWSRLLIIVRAAAKLQSGTVNLLLLAWCRAVQRMCRAPTIGRGPWAEREVGTLVALRWAVGGVLPVSKLHGLPCSESRESDKNVVTVQSNEVRMFRAFLLRNIYWIRVTGTPSSGSLTPASVVITAGRVNPPTWSSFPVTDTISGT